MLELGAGRPQFAALYLLGGICAGLAVLALALLLLAQHIEFLPVVDALKEVGLVLSGSLPWASAARLGLLLRHDVCRLR